MINHIYAISITLVVEAIVFLLYKNKSKEFWVVFVLANIFTNLFINVSISLLNMIAPRLLLLISLYFLETAAIVFEYIVYTKTEGKSKSLLLFTILANVASYGAGVLIFGHI